VDTLTIKLWQGDIAATETDCPYYWDLLDQNEQQRAQAFKHEVRRRYFVEIRARLRILLGKVVDSAPEKLHIDIAEHGKPFLPDYPELTFNLSHTGNKMAVAIAYDCLLGVDIELCKPRENLAALVAKCFAEDEQSYWQKLPEHRKAQAFYRFWTRKEAVLKATGRGIALGLQQCVINPANPSELLRIPESYGLASDWLLQDFDLAESVCGAVAVLNGNKERKVKMEILAQT
jgi:4'-phosphopantetheinyl transferase